MVDKLLPNNGENSNKEQLSRALEQTNQNPDLQYKQEIRELIDRLLELSRRESRHAQVMALVYVSRMIESTSDNTLRMWRDSQSPQELIDSLGSQIDWPNIVKSVQSLKGFVLENNSVTADRAVLAVKDASRQDPQSSKHAVLLQHSPPDLGLTTLIVPIMADSMLAVVDELFESEVSYSMCDDCRLYSIDSRHLTEESQKLILESGRYLTDDAVEADIPWKNGNNQISGELLYLAAKILDNSATIPDIVVHPKESIVLGYDKIFVTILVCILLAALPIYLSDEAQDPQPATAIATQLAVPASVEPTLAPTITAPTITPTAARQESQVISNIPTQTIEPVNPDPTPTVEQLDTSESRRGYVSLSPYSNPFQSEPNSPAFNPTISDFFLGSRELPYFKKVFDVFKEAGPEELSRIPDTQIVIGSGVDSYLENGRLGSEGTTLMYVDEGIISFPSIALERTYASPDFEDTEYEFLRRLLREEFFQMYQYNEIVATLYNNGYFENVANINTPDEMEEQITTGNLRAWLELPQAEFLAQTSSGSNAYNFYIGSEYYEGAPYVGSIIEQPFQAMINFIRASLTSDWELEDFFSADATMKLNDQFRLQYLDYYLKHGFRDKDVQIWNVIGMRRSVNDEIILDIQPKLRLPKN